MQIDQILAELGYTWEWIVFDILDEAFVRAQYAEFLDSNDKNPEHYRAAGFERYLRTRSSLTDEEVDIIFRLRDAGPDKTDLKELRIRSLLRRNVLTCRQQTELASRHPAVLKPPLYRIYVETSLIRKLRREGLSEAVFEEIQKKGNSSVQGALLDRADLGKNHVQWLATFGSKQSIRNRASQMLQSVRFRQT